MLTQNVGKEVELRELIERMMFKINTCIPGIIQSFDSAKQTVTVIPAIKMRTMIDGEEDFIELPKIIEVPIIFPVSTVKGFAITLPVSEGDSCLLLFSQRSIDNWHDLGGIQRPEDGVGSRHHDLTDAFAIFAPVPLPDVYGEWESDGIEIRNKDKYSRFTLKDDEIVAEITQLADDSSEESTQQDLPVTRVTLTKNQSLIETIEGDESSSITSTKDQIKVEVEGGEDSSSITIVKDSITMERGDATWMMNNDGVTLTGNLLVSGSIESQTSVADPNGTMQEMRDIFNAHTQPVSGATAIAPTVPME